MSLATMIPTKWSAYILGSLYKQSVFLPLANSQIKSDISLGNVFKVNVVPKLAAENYAGTATPAEATSASYSFNVDQKKFNAIRIRDEDAQQGIASMDSIVGKFTESVVQSLSDAVDGFMAASVSAMAKIGSGAAPIDATDGTKALSTLRTVKKGLDAANIPSAGRWLVVGPSFAAQLLAGASAILTSNEGVVGNGFVGRIYGMDVYMSNNVISDTSADEVLIAGYNETLALAHNVTTLEVIRDNDSFANIVRGLYVYGGGSLGHATTDVRGIACYVDTIA